MSDHLSTLIRQANPIPDPGHLGEAELESALTVIEQTLAGQRPKGAANDRRHRLRLRPALAFALTGAVVILAIALPVLLLADRQPEVAEPTPTISTMPPSTTVATTTTPTSPPSTTATAPTTSAPAVVPITQVPAITWTRVPHQPAFDNADFGPYSTALIAAGPGLVGVGHVSSENGEPRGTVFVSGDGTTWDRIDAPWQSIANGDMSDVAVGPGSTIVAVGVDDFDAGVWVSTDGLTWNQIISDGLAGDDLQVILGVVAGGPGFVAVGRAGENAAVWVSPDGYEWTRVEDEDLLAGDDRGVVMYDVKVGGPGLVAVGRAGTEPGDSRPAVWVSADGSDWERTSRELFAAVRSDTGLQSVTTDPATGRLIAFGYDVWTSIDGYSWDVTEFDWKAPGPPPGVEVAWRGEIAVAAGSDWALAFWISGDGGATWARVDTDTPEFEGFSPQVYSVVEWDGRFIVGGAAGEAMNPVGAVWIGTLDD